LRFLAVSGTLVVMLQTKEKKSLYERYGKSLERTHKGEYLAIGPKGQTVLGKRAGEALRKAIKSFGSGNFGLFRIGHATFGEWLVVQR